MKVRYKIRAGAKRSELLLQCNYNPPGFLRNLYLRSHYSWTQRHADTLRQWLNEMLTPTKRSQPDMPTFSHVDLLAGSHVGMLYADTDLLKRLLPDVLRRWHGDMQTWRHTDACWHVDMLIQTCWCWHSDVLTSWCADMQTPWRHDADILTCQYANVQTRWCLHADLLTGWRVDMQTYRDADAVMLTGRLEETLTRGHTVTLKCLHGDMETRWRTNMLPCWHTDVDKVPCECVRDTEVPAASVQSPSPFNTINFERFTIFPEVYGSSLTRLTISRLST